MDTWDWYLFAIGVMIGLLIAMAAIVVVTWWDTRS